MRTADNVRLVLRNMDTPLITEEMIENLDWDAMRQVEGSLSSGEHRMLYVALAIWNGHREASVSDLLTLDRSKLSSCLVAIMRQREIDLAALTEAGLGAGR